MKSRFFFNISLVENIKNILSIIFFKNQDFDSKIKEKMKFFYNESNFYFYDYGRTAFYEILTYIKKNTKKNKILVNSLTLFEIINVIKYLGFEPIFIDNNKNSFDTNINLENEENIDDIAAILITHLNGVNKNILNISNQIKNYNSNNKSKKIYLIEDCAVSFGAIINDKYAGSYGDFSFLSFNIMKNITSYTGGALIDNKKKIISELNNYSELSKFDILKKSMFLFTLQLLNNRIFFPLFFRFVRYSQKKSFNFFLKKYRSDFKISIEKKFPKKFKYRTHDLQKKILYKQFEKILEMQKKRIAKAKIYYDNLKILKELKFPQTEFTSINSFLEFPIICSSIDVKKKLFEYLLDNCVDVKNYYYKNCSEEKIYNEGTNICLQSKDISENILMLPVHEKIENSDQKFIIKYIFSFFEKKNQF